MYSCHSKLRHIIDTGCREKGFKEVSRGPAVCVGTNSNGDTLPFLGHYGCHCISQVVEEIPTTCASCESWRKHLYKCMDIHIRFFTKSDRPFTVFLCFPPFILWASVQRCICSTGISLVILKFDGNLLTGIVLSNVPSQYWNKQN